MILTIPMRILRAVGEVCERSSISEVAIEFTNGRYRVIASDTHNLFLYEGKHDLMDFPRFIAFNGSRIKQTMKRILGKENSTLRIEAEKITLEGVEFPTIVPKFILSYRKVFPFVPSETFPMLSENSLKVIGKVKRWFKEETVRNISFGEHKPFLTVFETNPRCYLVSMPLYMTLDYDPEAWEKELSAIKEEF